MELEKTLKNAGLNDKQAKVYLANLQLGSASATKISQKAGLPRSTVYEILEILQKDGFISTFKKKSTNYFGAEEPKKIIETMKMRTEILEKALPQFRAMYGQTRVQPTVRFYQGREGMKIVLSEFLAEAKQGSSFSSAEDLFEILGDIWPDFVAKRVKKRIPARVILKDSAKARERRELGPKQLREVKIFTGQFKYHGMVMIWTGKIAMFSFGKDLVALLIESEELANIQQAMFDLIWNSL